MVGSFSPCFVRDTVYVATLHFILVIPGSFRFFTEMFDDELFVLPKVRCHPLFLLIVEANPSGNFRRAKV
jgi:hypothetical protein